MPIVNPASGGVPLKRSRFFIALILSLTFLSSVSLASDPLYLYGLPQGSAGRIVDHQIYILCNNAKTKFADWVSYIVSPETVQVNTKTTRCWKADPLIPPDETLEPSDYKGAHKELHTDRGHQAPLASFKGTSCWAETNYLSNITPQSSGLNQGPWRLLEEHVRDLAREGYTVYVMTGTLYEHPMPSLPKADEPHQIPSGYWKIAAYERVPGDPSTLHCEAWIMDQNTARKTDFRTTRVSVDEVEMRARIDVFSELDDSLEKDVEGSTGDNTFAFQNRKEK